MFDDTAKEKAKVDSKELVMCTLAKNKHKAMIWWSEEDSFWWSKGKKGRKGLSKGKNKFPEGDSRTFLKKKVQTKITKQSEERVKIRGEERKRKFLFSFRILCLRVAK